MFIDGEIFIDILRFSLLGTEIAVKTKNSTKARNSTVDTLPMEDGPLETNPPDLYDYYYDPNAPPAKSAACIIL